MGDFIMSSLKDNQSQAAQWHILPKGEEETSSLIYTIQPSSRRKQYATENQDDPPREQREKLEDVLTYEITP